VTPSLLRHLRTPIPGINTPWVSLGMPFSSSVGWQREDHRLYLVAYLHSGVSHSNQSLMHGLSQWLVAVLQSIQMHTQQRMYRVENGSRVHKLQHSGRLNDSQGGSALH
jgi:hypothetical protein